MIGNIQVIEDKLSLLNNFEDAVLNFAEDLMKDADVTNFILDLQEDQLDHGIRSDNSEIEPEYKPRTKLIKEYKGQPTDRVTLKDTGEWRSAFKVQVMREAVLIENPDYLTAGLQAKYLETIIGLTEQNITLVRLRITPDFASFSERYFKA